MKGRTMPPAMIFAAGLGTRMRPLTDDRAKAEVDLFGRPLISHALARLRDAGVSRAAVNVHAHAERLRACLEREAAPPAITICDEREQLLETGGGLKKALPILDAPAVLTVNVDVFWVNGREDALCRLVRHFDPVRMDGLLLIVRAAEAHGYDGRGDFEMDPMGRLDFRDPRHVSPYVFGGVALLAAAPVAAQEETVFSLSRVWRRSAAEGRLHGLLHDGLWAHIGTPLARDETEARWPEFRS
ncbi:MAG: nucleotidyltransferase family protein [Rhodothalassiaceae bacterium]